MVRRSITITMDSDLWEDIQFSCRLLGIAPSHYLEGLARKDLVTLQLQADRALAQRRQSTTAPDDTEDQS